MSTLHRGDIYRIADKSRNFPELGAVRPDYVFECVAKTAIFTYWAHLKRQPETGYCLEDMDAGSCLIKGRPMIGTEIGEHVCVGVLIPNDVSKTDVARELRRRFGQNTVLLKPSVALVPDENTIYLRRIAALNSHTHKSFRTDLIQNCGQKFATDGVASDAERLKAYLEVRGGLVQQRTILHSIHRELSLPGD